MDDEIQQVRRVVQEATTRSAFDYLLAHARGAAFKIQPRIHGAVKAVGLQWPERKATPFSVQAARQHLNFYLRTPILKTLPELRRAAELEFGQVKENSLAEYRLHLHSVADVDRLLEFLRGQEAWPDHRHDRRFVAETYAPLTGEHLLNAARRLAAGYTEHRFGPSTEYDVLFDGHRLAPKAVFGIAATEALGFPVGPENFTAGKNSFCFGKLRAHGYLVVPKGGGDPLASDFVSDEDRAWAEGRKSLVAHLRRERGVGLAAAKRDQFRRTHGRLFCERCSLDPIEAYGEFGEACIEVHHDVVQVADMGESHQTRLDDLQCLCANCHRVVHRRLKAKLPPEGHATT